MDFVLKLSAGWRAFAALGLHAPKKQGHAQDGSFFMAMVPNACASILRRSLAGLIPHPHSCVREAVDDRQ
jgi:hypothetical protein